MRAELATGETDLRRGEAERPVNDPAPVSGNVAAKASTKQSLLSRRRLSLLAVILGLGSVALSVTVVVSSLLENRDAAERRDRESTQLEAQMLASTVKSRIDEKEHSLVLALNGLFSESHPNGPAADEHFVIINNNKDSFLVLDTGAANGKIHRPSPPDENASEQEQAPETRETRDTIINVREQMRIQDHYSGEFFSGNGLLQLGSFANASGVAARNAEIGCWGSTGRKTGCTRLRCRWESSVP